MNTSLMLKYPGNEDDLCKTRPLQAGTLIVPILESMHKYRREQDLMQYTCIHNQVIARNGNSHKTIRVRTAMTRQILSRMRTESLHSTIPYLYSRQNTSRTNKHSPYRRFAARTPLASSSQNQGTVYTSRRVVQASTKSCLTSPNGTNQVWGKSLEESLCIT